MLGHSLRRAVADSTRPHTAAFGSAIRPDPGNVFGWRQAVLGIADRLEQPGAVNPCGVARVMLLLTDGASPLYVSRAGGSLAEVIWSIADGLRP